MRKLGFFVGKSWRYMVAGCVGALVPMLLGAGASKSPVRTEVVTRRLTIVDAKGKTVGYFGMDPVVSPGHELRPILKVLGDKKAEAVVGFEGEYPEIYVMSPDGKCDAHMGTADLYGWMSMRDPTNTLMMRSFGRHIGFNGPNR